VAWVKVTLLKASGRFTGSSFCSRFKRKESNHHPMVAFTKVRLPVANTFSTLSGRSFWQLKIQPNATWSLRKILKLRGLAKKFLKFSVGDGSSFFFFFLISNIYSIEA
jgi:hypothetical protein